VAALFSLPLTGKALYLPYELNVFKSATIINENNLFVAAH